MGTPLPRHHPISGFVFNISDFIPELFDAVDINLIIKLQKKIGVI